MAYFPFRRFPWKAEKSAGEAPLGFVIELELAPPGAPFSTKCQALFFKECRFFRDALYIRSALRLQAGRFYQGCTGLEPLPAWPAAADGTWTGRVGALLRG